MRLKSLKAIRFLMLKGHEGFHRDLQLRTEGLSACASYRGPLDNVHGDSINKQVRDQAAELLRLVYEDPKTIKRERPRGLEMRDTYAAGGSNMGSSSGSIGGSGAYGNTVISSSSSGGSTGRPSGYGQGGAISTGNHSTGKMWGYGNPSFANAQQQQQNDPLNKIKDVIVTAIESVTAPPPGVVRSSSMGSGALPNSYKPQALQPVTPGGGWGSAPSETLAARTAERPAERQLEQEPEPIAYAEPQPLVLEGSLECKLVDEITAPGGSRATPQRDELQRFCQRARNLKLMLIVQRLAEKLEQGSTAEVLKALCVVESIIVEEVPGGSGAAQGLSYAIQPLTQSTKPAIKTKAEKILLLVDEDQSSYAAPEQNASIFGHQEQQQQYQQPPQQQQSDEADLFAGLEIAPGAAAGHQPSLIDTAIAAAQPPATISTATSAADSLLFDLGGDSSVPIASTPLTRQTSDLDELIGAPVEKLSAQSLSQQLYQQQFVPQQQQQYGSQQFYGSQQLYAQSPQQYAPSPQQYAPQQQYVQQQQYAQSPQQQYPPQQYPQGYPQGYAAQPPVAASSSSTSLMSNAALIGKSSVAGPNYLVSSQPQGSSSSGFGFTDKKRDAFDFVKQEMNK